MTRFTSKYVSVYIECTTRNSLNEKKFVNSDDEDISTASSTKESKASNNDDVEETELPQSNDNNDHVTAGKATNILKAMAVIQFTGSVYVDGK